MKSLGYTLSTNIKNNAYTEIKEYAPELLRCFLWRVFQEHFFDSTRNFGMTGIRNPIWESIYTKYLRQ